MVGLGKHLGDSDKTRIVLCFLFISSNKVPCLVLAPRLQNFFSCSTQLSIILIMLINVKMPTIVGILTFISIINTTSKKLKAKHFIICGFAVEISCSVELSMKKVL